MESTVIATRNLLEELEYDPDNEVTEVIQNVACILATPEGSVPLERNMGMPMTYQDSPEDIAVYQLEAELDMALSELEPRATLSKVTAERTDDGTLEPLVEVILDG